MKWRTLFFITLFAAAGCGEGSKSSTAEPAVALAKGEVNAPEGAEEARGAEGGDGEADTEAFVSATLAQLDKHIKAHFGNVGKGEAIGAILAEKPKKKDDLFKRRDLLRATFIGRDGQAIQLGLVESGALTDAGKAALGALTDADRHALPSKRYQVEAIEERLPALAEARGKLSQWSAPALSAEEASKIQAAVREAGMDVEGKGAAQRLVALLLGPQTPTPELARQSEGFKGLAGSLSRQEAELELLLAEGLLLYTWDMRYSNKNWFRDIEFPRKQEEQTLKLEELMVDAVVQAADGDMATFIGSLPPQFEQYDKLLKSRERYKAIVEAGGWSEVKPIAVRRGTKHDRLIELKARMALEGYYEAAEDEAGGAYTGVWNQALLDGITHYQTTHQIQVKGESTKFFWESLNVSAKDRLEQIELTIQRWRESRIGNDATFIHVNIPDFHAEGWVQGERKIRFRVVTGNRDKGCHRKLKVITYVNATPLMSDQIETIILNPYWNIPERILKEEILPEYRKDPNYLEEHNYECVQERAGACVRMRQAGGEGNALGQVKFLFPNEHGVYMHDTPKKAIFNYPTRAYSHGCMRVHEPLKFAEYLLKNDGQWSDRQFERWMSSGKENPIRLKTPVPIHVEYYTVRVDEDGLPNFLSDVYKYDEERLSEEKTKLQKCTPTEFDDFVLQSEEEEIDPEADGDDPEADEGNPEGEGDKAPDEEGDKAPGEAGEKGPAGDLKVPRALEEAVDRPPVPIKLRTIEVPKGGEPQQDEDP